MPGRVVRIPAYFDGEVAWPGATFLRLRDEGGEFYAVCLDATPDVNRKAERQVWSLEAAFHFFANDMDIL